MKKLTIKTYIITAFLLLAIARLSAISYPNVDENVRLDMNNQTMLNKKVLEPFLDSFKTEIITDFSSITQKVASESSALKSLESVLNIQSIQLDKLKREKLPKFSFINTPQTPLYGYRNNTSSTGPGTTLKVESHTIGINGGIQQQLPTAGSIDLSLSNSASYAISSTPGSTWGWQQSPAATLSFSQPLFINDKVVDFSYANTLLGRQEEKKELDAKKEKEYKRKAEEAKERSEPKEKPEPKTDVSPSSIDSYGTSKQ